MLKLLAFLGLSILLFSGCNSGVEPQEMNASNLIAVSGFISPQDSVMSIYVFKGQKIGSIIRSDSAQITNAKVIAASGTVKANLTYNSVTKRYEAPNPFRNAVAGTEIQLQIESQEYTSVQAKATIPPALKSPVVEGSIQQKDFLFTVKWNNEQSYKLYTVWTHVEGEIKTPYGQFPLTASIDQPDNGFYFPSDKQQSGLNDEAGMVGSANEATSKEVILYVTVANVDETYFKFYKSFRDYQDWMSNSSGFIPNFNEPIPIYSNITNGIGYFAAYNRSTAKIKIK